MEGFGSNGGEELISYLMTGESIIMQGNSNEWKKWYENMSKKIISIQKQDGSWKDIIASRARYFARPQRC
jgi:hypothetical protein